MEADHAGELVDRLDARGDIGEADDDNGVCQNRLEVESGKNAHHTIPAAHRHQTVDLGIVDELHELLGTLAILCGEIAETLCQIATELHLEAEIAKGGGGVESLGLRHTTGRSN